MRVAPLGAYFADSMETASLRRSHSCSLGSLYAMLFALGWCKKYTGSGPRRHHWQMPFLQALLLTNIQSRTRATVGALQNNAACLFVSKHNDPSAR